MHVLIVGVGVIGTAYGAHLGAAGHQVSVFQHGQRSDEATRDGLVTRDVLTGEMVTGRVRLAPHATNEPYDVVLVAVRREQLTSALIEIIPFASSAAILVFGNNPDGRTGVPSELLHRARLGFPGIGGTLVDGVAEYVRIPQQPTALEAGSGPHIAALGDVLERRGFAVQRVRNMDGWLNYHAVFVACVAAALYRCGSDPLRLAADRGTLHLMCTAVTQGFAGLRRLGVRGAPRNLSVLHHPLLGWVAVRYWARTMASTMGELCFAAHARRAQPEMRMLMTDVLGRIGASDGTAALRTLLLAEGSPRAEGRLMSGPGPRID